MNSAAPARPSRSLTERECLLLLQQFSVPRPEELIADAQRSGRAVGSGWKHRTVLSTLTHNAVLLYAVLCVAALVVLVAAMLIGPALR